MVMWGVFHPVSLKGRLKRKSLHGFSVSHAALHGVWQVGLWGAPELNSTYRQYKYVYMQDSLPIICNEKQKQVFALTWYESPQGTFDIYQISYLMFISIFKVFSDIAAQMIKALLW